MRRQLGPGVVDGVPGGGGLRAPCLHTANQRDDDDDDDENIPLALNGLTRTTTLMFPPPGGAMVGCGLYGAAGSGQLAASRACCQQEDQRGTQQPRAAQGACVAGSETPETWCECLWS